jgi:predicted lipoprotein with Yx(FWY)xxD motif
MRIPTAGRRREWLPRGVLAGVAAVSVLALAACGSGNSSGGAPPAAAGSGGSTATVMIGTAAGQTGVLATADGRTLYTSDQESGAVLCKSGACTAIWVPLTVNAGQTPAGPSQLTGMLGTMMRPDGTTQVTLDGKPLYTFSIDRSPGQVRGDGQKDSFGGVNFTWHVARAAGAASAPSATGGAPSSGGGGGGYGP